MNRTFKLSQKTIELLERIKANTGLPMTKVIENGIKLYIEKNRQYLEQNNVKIEA